MSVQNADFIVIGAGIAGSSAAAELAGKGRVVVLERESQPGYHTTGRSAAMYEPVYGPPLVRKLILASHDYLSSPPEGFCEGPILTPRGSLHLFRPGQDEYFEEAREDIASVVPDHQVLDRAGIESRIPVVRPDFADRAIYFDASEDIDVHALHQGYLRFMKSAGGELVVNAEVEGISRSDGGGDWLVSTRAGNYAAPVLVNAAGAWCDVVAEMAGVAPIGLQPRRRNAVLVNLPDGMDPSNWPVTFCDDPLFYCKPDAGRLMVSPADEIPSPPCDARPEEIDIAIALDRLETATTIPIGKPEHDWAGLRSFVEDEMLVAGFDADAEGFFWLTGQGGFGIETSPTMMEITGALISGDGFPERVAAFGLSEADLSPARLT